MCCPVARGGLFGTRPIAALCIQVHPATSLLPCSQLAQGWDTSRAGFPPHPSMATLARCSQQRSTTGRFGQRRATLAGSSWPKDKADAWPVGPCEASAEPRPPGNWSGWFPNPGRLRGALPTPAPCPAEQCWPRVGSLPSPAAGTAIPGRAQQDLRKGRTPAKQRHEAFASPQGAMLLETNPWQCWWPDAPRGAEARRRHGHSALPPARAAKRADGLAGGQGSSARDAARHPPRCPGTTPARSPSPPGTAPVPADFALWQWADLPRPCPCCTAAALKHMASVGTPKTAPAGTRVPSSVPVDGTRGATRPHGADSSSWVASPVIDVLSAAQQLGWFRVNCARNYPAQKGWGSPGGSRQQVCGVCCRQSRDVLGRAVPGESSPLGSPSPQGARQQGTAQLPPEANWVYVRGHSAVEATKATRRDVSREDARCYKQSGALWLAGMPRYAQHLSRQGTHKLNSSWTQPKPCSTHECGRGTAGEQGQD